jgi:hypothetical protein
LYTKTFTKDGKERFLSQSKDSLYLATTMCTCRIFVYGKKTERRLQSSTLGS